MGSASCLWGAICPAACTIGACDVGGTPFMPLGIWGRPAGIRPTSFPPLFHCCPFPCGRFFGVALGHTPRSPVADCATPLGWPLGWPFNCPLELTAVEFDDVEEFEDMEDDELVRGIVFRGTKTPLTSSEFIEFRDWPPLIPHAGRLILEKLGGLATAVMRKDSTEGSTGERNMGGSGSRGMRDSEYHRCPLAPVTKLIPCMMAVAIAVDVFVADVGRGKLSEVLVAVCCG